MNWQFFSLRAAGKARVPQPDPISYTVPSKSFGINFIRHLTAFAEEGIGPIPLMNDLITIASKIQENITIKRKENINFIIVCKKKYIKR